MVICGEFQFIGLLVRLVRIVVFCSEATLMFRITKLGGVVSCRRGFGRGLSG
jgi:hypothetical protein